MNTVLRKIVTTVLVVAFAWAGLPIGSAYAAAPTPQAPATRPQANARLALAFARQTLNIKRIGLIYQRLDLGFPQIQKFIAKAKARGQDVTQAQAALDAYESALATARPSYDRAKSLADARSGFDANGNVTDPVAARATVLGIRQALLQYRSAIGTTRLTLAQALLELRLNRPTPTPTIGA
jgi:hypothetical protein